MDFIRQYDSDSDSDRSSEAPAQLPSLPQSIADSFQRTPTSMKLEFSRTVRIPPGFVNCYTSTEFTPSVSSQQTLKRIINDSNTVCKYSKPRTPRLIPTFQNELNITNPLHLSLTDNFFLSRDSKSQFKAQLQARLQNLALADLRLTFEKVILVPNSHARNVFLALKISTQSHQRILPLFNTISGLVTELSGSERIVMGPVLSSDCLHVSIAQGESDFDYGLDQLNAVSEELQDIEVDPDLEFKLTSVKVLDGQGKFTIDLRA